MTFFQAIILAIVQGITEPFPVSSLGHAVLIPSILHWSLDEHSPIFLPFLTMLHVGTLLALAHVFWKDWQGILYGLFRPSPKHTRPEAIRICALLVTATIPAILLGGLFEHALRHVFANPLMVAGFLTLNGLLLIITEMMIRRSTAHSAHTQTASKTLNSMSYKDALIIGIWQCLALLPGLSRSGATINGSLTRKLSHLSAVRFSLLLAQPIILAATAKEAWQLRHTVLSTTIIEQALIGAIVAGLTALLCSRYLLRFFENDNQHTLKAFGLYCLVAGGGSFILIFFNL